MGDETDYKKYRDELSEDFFPKHDVQFIFMNQNVFPQKL